MRKGQQKFLDYAKRDYFPDDAIAILSDEHFTISELDMIYRYLYVQLYNFPTNSEIVVQKCKENIEIYEHLSPEKQKMHSITNFLFPTGKQDNFRNKKQTYEILDLADRYVQNHTEEIRLYEDKYSYSGLEGNVRWFIYGLCNSILKDSDNKLINEKAVGEYVTFIINNMSNIFTLFYASILSDYNAFQNFLLHKENSVAGWLCRCNNMSCDFNKEFKEMLKKYPNATFFEILEKCPYIELWNQEKCPVIVINGSKRRLFEVKKNMFYQSLCQRGFMKMDDEQYEVTICKYDDAVLNNMIKVAPEADFYLRQTAYTARTRLNEKSIGILISKYDQIAVLKDNYERKPTPCKKIYDLKVVLFQDGGCYMERKKKLVPLMLKDLLAYNDNPFAMELFSAIMDTLMAQNLFLKDVMKDIEEMPQKCFIIPKPINTLMLYHSKKEFMLNEYKTACGLRIAWNKRNLNYTYLIMKCKQYLNDKSFQKLLQLTDGDIKKIILKSYAHDGNALQSLEPIRQKCKYFLQGILTEKFQDVPLKEEGDLLTILDYINMAMNLNEKISLTFKSYTKLLDAHDDLTEKGYIKATRLVKIPKNTKFAELRKILPKDFEWIKSKSRLVKETVMQHHCVWSYAYYISHDQSAIYSYLDKTGEFSNGKENTRYTIEFCRNKKNQYFINQVKGKYNAANCKEMKRYIENLLSAQNKGEKMIA